MWEGVLSYLGMVGRFHGDDSRFCDCQSNLVPIVWCKVDLIDPSFLQTLDLIGSIFLSCSEPPY